MIQFQTVFKSPKIMGIINITEDSFSDGGKYLKLENAIKKINELIQDGADIIDLGAASSHPDAKNVSFELEIERLKPILEVFKKKEIFFSIDSFQKEVQRFALTQNIAYLNDISGFANKKYEKNLYKNFDVSLKQKNQKKLDNNFEKKYYEELSHSNCKLILMHSIQRDGKANREITNPKKVYESIIPFFEKRLNELIKNKISQNRIILDPGMGFFLGENPETSCYVLTHLSDLKKYFSENEFLISVSRKSFLGNLTKNPISNRNAESLSAELYACLHCVNYIRTHNPKYLKDALKIWEVLF